MKNAEKPASSSAPMTKPRDGWWTRFIRYAKRRMDERAAKKKNEPAVDRAARVTAKATAWIALFTFVSIAVSGGTLWILSGQLKEMHEGGVDIHTNAYRDLRPYVQVTKFDFAGDVFKGEAIKGKASIINSGRTPAINVNGCADIALKPNGDPMTDDFPCPAPNNPKRIDAGEHSQFSLGSGISGFSVDSPGTTIIPKNISVDTFRQLLATGAFRVYFYGYVNYTDLIETETVHQTTFCGRYNVYTGSLDVCEKHNRTN